MDKKPSIEAIATRFVNLNSKTAPNFLRDYSQDIRPGLRDAHFLCVLGNQLREAWDRSKWSTAEGNLEQIFADRLAENFAQATEGLKPGEMRESAWPDEHTPFDRAAFRIRLGESRPVFERRDLLDDIAWAILRAASLGLLRTCRGHRRGWGCPTPFLVADEQRRVYCYMRCGDETKSRSKKRWWKANLSAAARRKGTSLARECG